MELGKLDTIEHWFPLNDINLITYQIVIDGRVDILRMILRCRDWNSLLSITARYSVSCLWNSITFLWNSVGWRWHAVCFVSSWWLINPKWNTIKSLVRNRKCRQTCVAISDKFSSPVTLRESSLFSLYLKSRIMLLFQIQTIKRTIRSN